MSIRAVTALSENRRDQPMPIEKASLLSDKKITSNLNEFGNFVNGFIANGVMIAVMQPFFTLKTYLMCGRGTPPMSSLYNGFGINIASGGPAEGVTFLVHSGVCRIFKKEGEPLTDGVNFGASAFAGGAGAFAIAPCERVMILQQIYSKSAIDVMRPVIADEGWRKALFKGVTPTVGRDSFYNIGIFGLNDYVRRKLEPHIKNKSQREIVASGLSGSICGLVSTPFDLVKTQMQEATDKVSQLQKNITKKTPVTFEESDSMWKTGAALVRSGGVKSLFTGAGARAFLIAGSTYWVAKSKDTAPEYFPKSKVLFQEVQK